MIKVYTNFPVLLDITFKQYLNIDIAIGIGLVLQTLNFDF